MDTTTHHSKPAFELSGPVHIFVTLAHDGTPVVVTLEPSRAGAHLPLVVLRDEDTERVLLAVPAMHASEGIFRTLLDAVDTDAILHEVTERGWLDA